MINVIAIHVCEVTEARVKFSTIILSDLEKYGSLFPGFTLALRPKVQQKRGLSTRVKLGNKTRSGPGQIGITSHTLDSCLIQRGSTGIKWNSPI